MAVEQPTSVFQAGYAKKLLTFQILGMAGLTPAGMVSLHRDLDKCKPSASGFSCSVLSY